MFKSNSILSSFKKTYKVLPKQYRKKSVISVLLLFLNSILDLAGLASLLPLISLILKDNFIQNNEYISSIYTGLGFTDEKLFIVTVALSVAGIIILKNLISLFIVRYQARFSFGVMKHSVEKLHRIYYQKGFSYFKNVNSNVTLRDIYTIPFRFASAMTMNLLSLLNEIVVLVLIIVGISAYDPKVLLLLIVTVLPTFYLFYRLTKNKIKQIGDETNELTPEIGKSLFQSIFGYVDVIITGTKEYFFKKAKDLIGPFANLNITKSVLNLAPTKVIESSMVLSIIILLIYGIYVLPSKEAILSLLSVYALAAYRIMPSINRMMISINNVTENQFTFDVMKELFHDKDIKEAKTKEKITFNKQIQLENVSFKYEDGSDNILSDFNMAIKKGQIIGIRGKSGGGKTTLMNILLGLLRPDKGKLKIDNLEINNGNIETWQKIIGYVQQDVYLLDATLAENIAFGVNKDNIDISKLDQVIESASLKDFVSSLPKGVNTRVGERGAQLSGGQKQRVGIARALYFDSEVLLFDEATSALDPQTEREITHSINELSKTGLTMIIIAHRETSLEGVDHIIEI